MTLFWHPTGPAIRYEDGVLHVENLNPEVKTRWRMTRWEMFRLGLRCLLSAVRR